MKCCPTAFTPQTLMAVSLEIFPGTGMTNLNLEACLGAVSFTKPAATNIYFVKGTAFLLIRDTALSSSPRTQRKCFIPISVFSGEFLAGVRGNLFDLKYIAPVQGQKLLDARPLYRENSRDASFLDKLLDASRIAQSDEAFAQFRLRSLFSALWEDVYRWAAETGSENAPSPYSEDERIKDMLSFIQQNFSHRLTVRQIAGVIPISERECYRLFKKHLGISPVEYLTDIRLRKRGSFSLKVTNVF